MISKFLRVCLGARVCTPGHWDVSFLISGRALQRRKAAEGAVSRGRPLMHYALTRLWMQPPPLARSGGGAGERRRRGAHLRGAPRLLAPGPGGEESLTEASSDNPRECVFSPSLSSRHARTNLRLQGECAHLHLLFIYLFIFLLLLLLLSCSRPGNGPMGRESVSSAETDKVRGHD